jgi:5-methylcytosine-specific restriction endonuclease McrA
MQQRAIAKYLTPWTFRRDQQQRFDALRRRDGDTCWRCKRPLRFDLPRGHGQAPTIEQIRPSSTGGSGTLDNLGLCHGRCNWMTADATPQVQERLRLKAVPEQPVRVKRPKKRAANG